MEIEKIRNTTDAELKHQQQELSDQLFRLKFQMKMGQNEGLQKVRGLRKDIARIRTVARERELGIAKNAANAAATEAPKPKKAAAAMKAAAPKSAKRSGTKAATAAKKHKKTEKK